MIAIEAPRDLARGLFVQIQVIQALILRETRTRFGQSQLGYLWALIEPLLWIGTMTVLYGLGGRTGRTGMTMVGFIGTGIITYELFRDSTFRVMAAVASNKPLLFYPQVKPVDLMWARIVLECATWFSVFTIILGGEALWLGELHIDSLLDVMVGLLMAGALGGALGSILCSLTFYFNSVERVAGAIFRPLMFVSGTFFALEDVPISFAEFLAYNPMIHVIEMVRDGWYRDYTTTRTTPWYPLAWILVLCFVATALERTVRSRIQVS